MEKIFTGPDDIRLPMNVRKLPKKKRERWVAIWNSVFRKCIKDRRKKRSTCESQAFRIANAAIKKVTSNDVADAIENFVKTNNCVITVNVTPDIDVTEVEQTP